MYTRIPDRTQCRASSAVRSFFLYSSSQDISCSLSSSPHLPQRLGYTRPLISGCGVIDGVVEKLIQQLFYFEFAGDFRGAVQNRLPFQEVPKVFLGQDDRPDELAQRHALSGALGANLQVSLLDVQLAFA